MVKLRDVMSRDVAVLRADTTLLDAALLMRQLNIGFLPVADGETLVGTLTDRDIAVRAMADGLDATTQVAVIMTPEVVWCYDDQAAEEAALLMARNLIRRLPVLSRDHKLVGIVSLGDIAVNTGDPKLAGTTLQCIVVAGQQIRK